MLLISDIAFFNKILSKRWSSGHNIFNKAAGLTAFKKFQGI